MPIYEYQCQDCEYMFEAVQRITEDPLTHCEKCHGSVKRLISQSSFILKGTGWYVTDYAKKDSKDMRDRASSKNSTSTTTNKSKSESKSENKTTSADSGGT